MAVRTWPAIAVLAMLAMGVATAQQPDLSKVEIRSEQLADNLYFLSGAGGNMALLTGASGALLVDDEFAPLHARIVAAIAALTDKPVRFVINTHWHGDHTGGNADFGKEGAVIVAHENTLKRLSTNQAMTLNDARVPAQAPEGWPVITFADSVSLHTNGEHIEVVHVANAHTDSDAIIYFRKANVVHTGDVFAGPAYPFIDTGSGGSLNGVIAATATIVARIRADTKIIPGHAPPQRKSDLEAFRGMVADAGLGDRVRLHGPYDHRRDLASIMAANHLFIHTSRFEGGPCLVLIELLQAGRFVVTSPVGGIPDIYAGRPELGTLVEASDPDAIAAAIEDGLARLAAGRIDPRRIRAVYAEHFHPTVAHGQWLAALGLSQPDSVPSDRGSLISVGAR